MEKRSLRWHLFQVLLLGILPVGLFAAALLYLNWRSQEEQRQEIQMETTRLLATAVDNALDSTIQRASMLARLWAAYPRDLRQVYDHANAALAASPDWEAVIAFNAKGELLFRTDAPFGDAPKGPALRPYSRQALRENRPVLSEVFVSSVRKQPTVAVAVPVSRGGAVTHVLIVSLELEWFDELLRRQGLPPGAIGGVFDTTFRFVARSRDGPARRGSDPAAGLNVDMRARPEGLGRYPSLDGTSVYTSWARTNHGWTVGFATAAEPIDGALLRHLALLGALLVGVIAAGLAFAALKGRRITSSFEALLEAAGRERDERLLIEQKARAEAENANRAKDEFLAMLGHELRNPLAAISNSVNILQMPARTNEHVSFAAGVIQRQSTQLKRLIDDLLDVGRVMTGKIRLQRQPLDLEAAVHQVIGTLQTAGTLANHNVEVRATSVWIEGDQARIEQIVTNLLTNAATYTPPSRAIRVTLSADAREAVLQVVDEGVGIAPEHVERIFDLFFQAEGAGHGRQGGLGIGLTLVKRLVELHGGRVSAQSAGRGHGAVFTVRLPAVAPAAASEPAQRSPSQGRTVLVVEDNVDARESLRLALEMRGHRVLRAADAGEALRVLRSDRPAVAIIDIGLPGMDGYSLARRIRSEFHKRISLVALTGYGADQDISRALAAGFEVHLTKPVDPAELDALVSRTGHA